MEPRLIHVDNPDESRAGERASDSIFFGPRGSRELYAVHTRFGSIEWVVVDHDRVDEETNLPEIIRQALSLTEVIEGIPDVWSVRDLNVKTVKEAKS